MSPFSFVIVPICPPPSFSSVPIVPALSMSPDVPSFVSVVIVFSLYIPVVSPFILSLCWFDRLSGDKKCLKFQTGK